MDDTNPLELQIAQENQGAMLVTNSAISQNIVSSAMLHVKLSKMVGVNTNG